MRSLTQFEKMTGQACKPEGEMLLVADATQDIYGTAKTWTDDVMKGAGFLNEGMRCMVDYSIGQGTTKVIHEERRYRFATASEILRK